MVTRNCVVGLARLAQFSRLVQSPNTRAETAILLLRGRIGLHHTEGVVLRIEEVGYPANARHGCAWHYRAAARCFHRADRLIDRLHAEHVHGTLPRHLTRRYCAINAGLLR